MISCFSLPGIMANSVNCHGKVEEFYYQISMGTLSVLLYPRVTLDTVLCLQVAVTCICLFVILPLTLVGTVLGRNLAGQPDYPSNISETVAVRIVKLAHCPRIALITIKLNFTVHFNKNNSANRAGSKRKSSPPFVCVQWSGRLRWFPFRG